MLASGETHFIYDRNGNLIAETDGTGPAGTVREYIYLPETEIAPTFGSRTVVDRPLAVVNAVNTASPALWHVHTDHLNRPVRMTDSAAAVVWNAQWLPWGNVFAVTGTANLDARFPGQWFQLESGLHYNWYRHYDPTIGRFTQPDPLGFVDGPSVYAYGRSSPQRFVDRKGLFGAGTSVDGNLGHGDFYGHEYFDYNLEDRGYSHPYLPFSTPRHFRQLTEVEPSLDLALKSCF